MYNLKLHNGKTLLFETSEKVFIPTGTTTLLLDSVREQIGSRGSILDIGCGIGVVGIALAAYGLATSLSASDISHEAVVLTEHNAVSNGCEVTARHSNLFEAWLDTAFDYIVDDVSGVAEGIAAVSGWFKNTSCESGYDGSLLTKNVIRQSHKHLRSGGRLFFPVISLSNETEIIAEARRCFEKVSLLKQKAWPLPDDLKPHLALLDRMRNEGVISYEEKFGTHIWTTSIYMAHN
ncbi:MAG: methyltransferase [Chitinophagaceae bacterium]|nr:methyltransferase [Chitinophagaceae bacterium]